MTHRNAYMTDELQAIYDQTVDFVAKEVTPHGDAWEEAGKVPREVLAKMGSLGMLGLRVPEEHGGLGMGMLASAVFSEALGSSTYAGFEATVLPHGFDGVPTCFDSSRLSVTVQSSTPETTNPYCIFVPFSTFPVTVAPRTVCDLSPAGRQPQMRCPMPRPIRITAPDASIVLLRTIVPV